MTTYKLRPLARAAMTANEVLAVRCADTIFRVQPHEPFIELLLVSVLQTGKPRPEKGCDFSRVTEE